MIRLRLPENGKKAQCDCLASTTYSVICNFGKINDFSLQLSSNFMISSCDISAFLYGSLTFIILYSLCAVDTSDCDSLSVGILVFPLDCVRHAGKLTHFVYVILN